MKTSPLPPARPGLRTDTRHARGGFTMIELMVVVAIMLLVLAMGIPAIREATHREALSQAVRDVTEACSKARARAIMTGVTTELRFHVKDRRIETGDAPAEDEAPGTVVTAKSPSAKAGAAIAYFSAKLSDRLDIPMLDVNFVEYKDRENAVVRFHPNGTSDELTLVMHSYDSGERRMIQLECVTGLAEVTVLNR